MTRDDVPTPDSERVLVLAPTAADATLTQSILAEAGLGSHICAGLRELSRELARGAGAVILTEGAFGLADQQCLVEALQNEPAWSDPPIILLSSTGADSLVAGWAMEQLGNVTVLERPVRVTTLVSALRTALRARHRQYQLRDQIQPQALLAAVVASSDDAIVSKTLQGVITSWNTGAERLFGYTAAEATGQPITIIIPPERWDEERDILRRLARGEHIEHFETVRRTKDGRRVDISLTISPIRDTAGRIVGASKVARDITERKRAADRLRESEARFRFLSESIPSIVWSADANGTVTYVNRRGLEYFGITEDQRAQQPQGHLLHPEDRERCISAWQRAVREGNNFEIEARNRRYDGAYRWFVTRAVPFRDISGAIMSWFGVSMDIHEQRELQEALRQADRRKDEFLATLAHELRNPLAPIRNALHIMRLRANDPPTVEQARLIMDRQLGQMVRLVDDLLDVGRITRGKLDLRKERVELASVVKNAVDTTRPLIEAAGHQLSVSLPSQAIHLDADPVRLAQVLANLLNNAAKYMDRGGRIWLSAQRSEREVILSVRDAGIGISASTLPTIFDMFTQIEESLEKSRGGLGIGLTLAKQLTELHGGAIEARSEGLGKGAEFTVRLPAVPVLSAVASPSDEDAVHEIPVRFRILVADDNLDAAESLGMMLRLMGHDVRTVRDGLQAVEEAAAFRPDLALLDIGMPGLSGYDVARRIREQRWGQEIVLVALTGWGQEEDKRKALEAGFDQHFTKPVSPVELTRMIARLHADSVRQQRQERRGALKLHSLSQTPKTQ
ncbi:MAG TPA: PAS domain S-box protein [Steroidobacteraceae bacterium]|nr:PAS domain S-box protein [Steroidobacteraceae bacterium]